jgi:hypothetical protein
MISILANEPISLLDIDVARVVDQMVEPLKSHFDQIVLRVIDEANESYPVGLDLAAESKRPHIDFSLGAGERLREMVGKGLLSGFSSFWTVMTASGVKPFSLWWRFREDEILHKPPLHLGPT